MVRTQTGSQKRASIKNSMAFSMSGTARQRQWNAKWSGFMLTGFAV